jgi:hypothetical protein
MPGADAAALSVYYPTYFGNTAARLPTDYHYTRTGAAVRHRPGDPGTLLIAAAIFLATVLAASLLPALRASRVAPVEALREE